MKILGEDGVFENGDSECGILVGESVEWFCLGIISVSVVFIF